MSSSKTKVNDLLAEFENLVTSKLSLDNASMSLTMFIQLVHILAQRQKRTGRSNLKRNMVKSAWDLLLAHHEKCFRFTCENELAAMLGDGGPSESDAVSYYSDSVLGSVQDAFGQKIIIGDHALVHLYKDADGDHTMESQFYQITRGKRLPWIRHVLANSKSVYRNLEATESGERRFLYTARAIIHESVEYFLVIVRKDRNKNLHFLTAFPIFGEDSFLETLESTEPYTP